VPECAKCTKKGIKCTGVGRQIRFIEGVISKGKRKGQTFPDVGGFTTKLGLELENVFMSTPRLEEHTETDKEVERVSVETEHGPPNTDIDDDGAEEIQLVRYQGQHDLPAWTLPDDGTFMPFYYDPGADLTLELLKPGIQMLFNHFSQSIASIMVVFDSGSNGYRNFLLPLAYEDDLVQRAVSVVAAFHMAPQRPDLLPVAEKGLSSIIQRLRADAFAGESNKVFSMSTWATVILLLVGETVTGSQDFVHLYPMLTNLLSHNEVLAPELTLVQRRFLLQQSRMYVVHFDLSFYFDFMFSKECFGDPCVAEEAIVYQDAIKQARHIYMRQALGNYHSGQLHEDVEELRLMVIPIQSDSPGMHTLPWVYFIAAASSEDQYHRTFFTSRLVQVYQKTRMNSILVALKRLEQIWLLQPSGEWARNPSLVNPVLII
ncbi:unnamed protein product, partial [Aureobasidium pullulans]